MGAARLEPTKQIGSTRLAKATNGDEQLRTEVRRLGEALAEEHDGSSSAAPR